MVVLHTDTATDFATAVTKATALLGANATDAFVAVQVGSDVVVFVDEGGNHAVDGTDDAILLVGKTLADIALGNFI